MSDSHAAQRFATLRSGRLDAKIFKPKRMLNRITNLEATTEAAITQNGCYRLGFYKF